MLRSLSTSWPQVDRKLTAGCSQMKNPVCRCSQMRTAGDSQMSTLSTARGAKSCKCIASVSQVYRKCLASVSQVSRNSLAGGQACTQLGCALLCFLNLIPFGKWSRGEWWSRNFSIMKISGLIPFPSIYRSSEWFLWVCPNSNVKLLNLIWVSKGIFQTHV